MPAGKGTILTPFALSFLSFLQDLLHPFTGASSASHGGGYLIWSGLFSDLSEITLVVTAITGLVMVWHHLNCHEPKCKRIGRHRVVINGHTWLSCGPHHREAFPNKPTSVRDHVRQMGGTG